MYARGMTVREIQGHLAGALRPRGLARSDLGGDRRGAGGGRANGRTGRWRRSIRWCSSTRCGSRSATRASCATRRSTSRSGVSADGTKEILGLWIEQTEGAKFWLRVMNELKNRGVSDILIAVVDGLKGFPEAINAVFPQTDRADLHRASDPPFAGFRLLERPQGRRRRAQGDLPGRGRRRRPGSAGGFRRQGPGAQNIRRSRRAGGATGSRSSRSSPFPKPCGGSSTPPTPSRR